MKGIYLIVADFLSSLFGVVLAPVMNSSAVGAGTGVHHTSHLHNDQIDSFAGDFHSDFRV